MGLRINTNVGAMNAHRQLTMNDTALSKSLQRLSSGLRINGAADDAAGLTIAEKMNSQVRGLNAAARNSQDSISLLQTAEGALIETESILQRMRELAVQASNDTLTDEDRGAIKKEIDALNSEINRIATTTQFNTQKLLNGGTVETGGLTFQVGANANQTMSVKIASAGATALGVDQIGVASAASAGSAITSIDAAIKTISGQRSDLGAVINRLEHTIKNLNVSSENLSAAESRIRDLDMASEVMTMTRNQILTQSSTSMLAQANQSTQNVLGLLR
ncbi:Flagellin [compost metagenome]